MRQNILSVICSGLVVVALSAQAADPAPAPTTYIYSGILRSINLQGRKIVVDGSAVPQTFVVPTDAEIVVKDKPRGELRDLMVGDGVQVKYTDDDGAHVAHQISLLSLKAP